MRLDNLNFKTLRHERNGKKVKKIAQSDYTKELINTGAAQAEYEKDLEFWKKLDPFIQDQMPKPVLADYQKKYKNS